MLNQCSYINIGERRQWWHLPRRLTQTKKCVNLVWCIMLVQHDVYPFKIRRWSMYSTSRVIRFCLPEFAFLFWAPLWVPDEILVSHWLFQIYGFAPGQRNLTEVCSSQTSASWSPPSSWSRPPGPWSRSWSFAPWQWRAALLSQTPSWASQSHPWHL